MAFCGNREDNQAVENMARSKQKLRVTTESSDCLFMSCSTFGDIGVEDSEEGCEVNGRVYRDGEVFQPSCKLQCRCLDGGFTCVPLCQEDVRLPTPDCPYPRRVEVPGKCCPEWICEARDPHLRWDAGAAPRAVSPPLPYACQEWGTEWSACSASCGVGFSTRVSNQNRYWLLGSIPKFLKLNETARTASKIAGALHFPDAQLKISQVGWRQTLREWQKLPDTKSLL
ncbi:PREDICTED: WNT1-inducible-signaling pathway protein 2-like [Apaloderma vittatum]|uniref:WNT1-inducible-signaling pathway protein 2-like n=1 Tax=Apaloderma vittatum TaxID=57397 RepID=UPI000521725B|nr:PREDICTED: WNT1-inducible-signaling pathway protein 2-like [Apaloderma vittatum]